MLAFLDLTYLKYKALWIDWAEANQRLQPYPDLDERVLELTLVERAIPPKHEPSSDAQIGGRELGLRLVDKTGRGLKDCRVWMVRLDLADRQIGVHYYDEHKQPGHRFHRVKREPGSAEAEGWKHEDNSLPSPVRWLYWREDNTQFEDIPPGDERTSWIVEATVHSSYDNRRSRTYLWSSYANVGQFAGLIHGGIWDVVLAIEVTGFKTLSRRFRFEFREPSRECTEEDSGSAVEALLHWVG
jgi:hypothetical protein